MKGHVVFAILSYILLRYRGVAADSTESARVSAPNANSNASMESKFIEFANLTTRSTFIDKSMLLRAFFGHSRFQLVTCPHKFGKTTNLSMMKKFLAVNVDEDGTPIERAENSETYQLFTTNLKIGPTLKSKSAFFHQNFNSFPVLYVSFENAKGSTLDEIIRGFGECLRNSFKSYEWLYRILLKHHPLDRSENPTIQRRMNIIHRVLEGETTENDVIDSMTALAKILFIYFKYQPIFLLIDDYDAPIINAIEQNLDIAPLIDVIERMFNKLFVQSHRMLKAAMITGTINVLNEATFSTITHCSFLDNHYASRYFGFTESDVCELLYRHGIIRKEQEIVKRYFNAYKITKTPSKIYNPYSIVMYSEKKNETAYKGTQLENYWVDSTKIANFLRCHANNNMSVDLMTELLQTKRIKFLLKKQFSLKDLQELRRITYENGLTARNEHADLFFSYLYHNGYLSLTDDFEAYYLPSIEIENSMSRLFSR